MLKPNLEIPIDGKAIREAILSVSEQQWANFFEILRQQQYNKLRSALVDEERQDIQTTIRALDSIQEKFSAIRISTLDKVVKL